MTSTLYSVACRIHGAGKEPFVLEVCCHAEDAAAACVIATRRAADHAAGIRRPRVFSERWARRDTSHVQVAILSVSTLDDCVVDEDDVAAPVVDGQLDIFDVIAGGSGNAT